MDKNIIPALVVAGARWNWARHYLRGLGYHDNDIRYILACTREGERITGDVKHVRFILDTT